MLLLRNVRVEKEREEILKGIDLEVKEGEIHVIFGPNGSGKTTLIQTIVGHPEIKAKGMILFKGQDLLALSMPQRAKLGIGAVFQHRANLKHLKVKHLLSLTNSAETFGLLGPDLLERDITKLSGGEWKLVDLAVTLNQNPDLLLLDELEAGVDVENLQKMAEVLKRFLCRQCIRTKRKKSAIIITHSGAVLRWLKADFGHVMIKGKLTPNANPEIILEQIQAQGYSRCFKCLEE